MRGSAVHSSSTRIVAKAVFWLRPFVLAAVGALLLAGSAYAAGTGPDESSEATGAVSEPAPESQAPAPAASAESSEVAPSSPPSEPAPAPAPAGEPTPTPPPPAPETVVPVPPEPTPAPPPPAPAPETVVPVPPESPVPVPVVGEVKEAVPVKPTGEEVKQAPAPPSSGETVSEPVSALGSGAEEALKAPPAQPVQEAGVAAASHGSGEAPPALLGRSPALPPGGPTVTLPTSAGSVAASLEGPMSVAAIRAAVKRSCALSALGGPVNTGCPSGPLGPQGMLVSSTLRLAVRAAPLSSLAVAAAAAVAAATTVPANDGHDGSVGGGHPSTPGPGPAPGGASGSAPAAGGSGLAHSGFLTLAGLLLLAAPRAMRRLRLSSRPWLTACFVLIPERPG